MSVSALRNTAVAFALSLSAPALAMPSMMDHWRITCAPKGANEKMVAKAEAKAGGGGLAGGMAALEYACLQNAMEKRRFELAVQKFNDAGGKGPQPVEDHRQSMASVKSASAKLDALVKAKKDDAKANYYLGYSLGLLGDEWAVNKLDDAIHNATSPELTARAELAMAEFLFDKKGAAAALEGYKKVAGLKDPFSAAYARYKLSWVDYASGVQGKNRNLQKQALTNLAKVSREASSKKGDDNDDFVGLAKVVKDDILALSIDYGNQADVQQILKSAGANDVYATFLERAGYAKWQENALPDAYKLFALAMKEQPKKTRTPQLNLNITQISAQMGNIPLVISNMKIIVNTFVKEKAPWRKKQKPADLKKTDKQLEGSLFDFCAALDQQARKDQQPKSLAAADEAYNLFTTSFPKSAKAYEARFYDGQIQFIAKAYLKAAQTLVAMITANPKGKFTKDGLDVMVTAAQTAVDNDKTKYEVAKAGSIKKPRDIPAIKKVYSDSLDLYVKMTPRTDKTPAMKFVAASVLYDYGHYKEAIKSYWSFVASYSNDPFAKQAAARILDYYKQQKEDEEFEKAKAKIAAIAPLGKAPELASYFVKSKGKGGKKKKKGEDGSDAEIAKKDGDGDGGDGKSEPVSEKKTEDELE